MESLAVRIFGSYKERDKLLRLLQYMCKLVAGSSQTNMGKRLAIIAGEFGSCRTIMRLFDDIPMLTSTLKYGGGLKESNRWLRALELMSNAANQLEHIALLAKHKVIDRDPTWWAAWCIYAWAVSLFSEVINAVTRIVLSRRARSKLNQEAGVESRSDAGEMHADIQNKLRVLKSQERHCYLAIVEHGTDLVNAIFWMTPGFRWSGTLSNRTAGLLGTISSIIKMLRLHNPALVTGK